MKRKKMIALIMASTLSLGLLAGCGESEVKQSESEVKQSDSEQASETTKNAEIPVEKEEVYDGVDNLQITEEPSEITMHYSFMINGAPTGDTPIWQEIANITNVEMVNTANPSISDEAQSLNTMLASGEVPDIIVGTSENMSSVVSQGALMPLDDLIAEYAPNVQKFLEDYPEAVAAGAGGDGKLYCLSGTLGGKAGQRIPNVGVFIRLDWLENLGLDVPTTFEAFEDVLYAFRNDDPNGNGVKDEIPYFFRDLGIDRLFQFWNAYTTFYVGEDGKVHYGKTEEEYKNALKHLAQWYEDGIIDPEIFTRGSQARQELLGNDIGGCTIDWFASTGKMNDTVREMVPEIDFAAIAPPADINGVVKMAFGRNALHNYRIGISVDCEDPVKAIRYLDFCFTEMGSRILGCGIESRDYTMVDGKFEVTEYAKNAHSGGYPNYLRSIGSYEFTSYLNLETEKSSMNEWSRTGYEMYENSDWIIPQFPVLALTEEEQKIRDDNKVNIDTAISEYEQSVLLGNVDIDATWDKHMEELNAMGLQEMVDAYNSAYERYAATIE